MTMTRAQVMALLKEHRNERGIAHWAKLGDRADGLRSFGIGLTQLRKLAKQVGRSQKLARQLWESDVYDAKVLGLLIDEPKLITREQAESQVDQLNAGMLSHVFASCDATLAKSPLAAELMHDWLDSPSDIRRRCAYSLVYELSKKKKVAGMDDAFFKQRIQHIQDHIHDEEMWVREAMLAALMGIGKRDLKLNKAAIRAAKKIGPVDIDYGDTQCEPLDVVKHLSAEHLQTRLAK